MRSAGDIITLVMADDHPVVRSVLRLLLEAEADFHVVAEVGDSDAALCAVVEHEPTVLVLDLNMPGDSRRSTPSRWYGSVRRAPPSWC